MADKNILEQMLEHLVNDDQAKAEELFHEYVVGKSREIYEELIESEIENDEEVEEAAEKDEDSNDEEVEEGFDDLAIEADDVVDVDPMGGDATDDLAGELDSEMDDEEGGEEDTGELFQDLEAIVDELQAKFDELQGGMDGEEGDDVDMDDMGDMGDEEDMKDNFELETVREYVEKVADGHGAEKKGRAETSDSKKSVVDNMKNDMGGTTANILSGRNGSEAGLSGAAGGALKGSPLSDTKAKEDNAGNINVPGGKAGKTGFTHKEPGHGAEKKGSSESADSKQSLFRGRR
jgi:hypothetical protein